MCPVTTFIDVHLHHLTAAAGVQVLLSPIEGHAERVLFAGLRIAGLDVGNDLVIGMAAGLWMQRRFEPGAVVALVPFDAAASGMLAFLVAHASPPLAPLRVEA